MGWIKWGFVFSFTWQHGRGKSWVGLLLCQGTPYPRICLGSWALRGWGMSYLAAPTEHQSARCREPCSHGELRVPVLMEFRG